MASHHHQSSNLNPYAQEYLPKTTYSTTKIINYNYYYYPNINNNVPHYAPPPYYIYNNPSPMQYQPLLGHLSPSNISPDPSHFGPKSPPLSQEQGGDARRLRHGSCSSGRSTNYGRKKGFERVTNNSVELCKGSSYGEERKKGIKTLMAVKPNGEETTTMIRNIPNQYTRDMLIKFLDEFCRLENLNIGQNDDIEPLSYDFLYLPMDFGRNANKGYAFVNFTHPIGVWKLHLACNDQRWEHFKSPKICKINCAAIQGKEKLVKHFGSSNFVCDNEDYLPVCFSPPRDGSGASVVETIIGNRNIRQPLHPVTTP